MNVVEVSKGRSTSSLETVRSQLERLKSLMHTFGYEMKTTGGSGRKFTKAGTASSFVAHEPHPHSILKAYQVREFIAFLKQEGHIQ